MAKFKQGNEYVFSSKKYLKWKRKNNPDSKTKGKWHQSCNGRKVEVSEGDAAGKIIIKPTICYEVTRDWCKCISVSDRRK